MKITTENVILYKILRSGNFYLCTLYLQGKSQIIFLKEKNPDVFFCDILTGAN